MNIFEFLVCALAVWRVTHLFAAEDGPFGLIARLRQRAGTGVWSGLMNCFYCLSLWIAVPFALLIADGWREWIVVWLALSAASIAWDHMVSRMRGVAEVWEVSPEREDNDELLRQSPGGVHLDAGPSDRRGSGPTSPSG